MEEIAIAQTDSPPPPEISVTESTDAEITDTESAFDLLVWAVNNASRQGKSLRTSSIKTIMRSADHNFDEKQLKNANGEYFAKFGDFIRAAAKRGLVRIEGKGIRMEVHPNGDVTSVAEIKTDPVHDPVPVDSGLSSSADPLPFENQPPSENDPLLAEIPTVEAVTIIEDNATAEEAPPHLSDGEYNPEVFSNDLNAPPQEPDAYVSDYRMRVLVVDALRNCEYPAPAHVIGKHCLETSEKRNVSLPNRRLNQLLTNARKMGLLKEADENAQEFTFVESTTRIKLFLEDES